MLSQLSYSPLLPINSITGNAVKVVGLGRFELPTSPLSGVRSNQLSYRPGTPFRTGPGRIACFVTSLTLLHQAGIELSRKVSRTQLNMQCSYAAFDHRC